MKLILHAVLFACVSFGFAAGAGSGEKAPPSETKLERFLGRWITSREGKGEKRYDVVLEFKGDEMTLSTEEGGKKGNVFTLKVIGADDEKRILTLGWSTHRYTIPFDFEAGKMVLVGRLINRPFEGFSLSGEYRRGEKMK